MYEIVKTTQQIYDRNIKTIGNISNEISSLKTDEIEKIKSSLNKSGTSNYLSHLVPVYKGNTLNVFLSWDGKICFIEGNLPATDHGNQLVPIFIGLRAVIDKPVYAITNDYYVYLDNNNYPVLCKKDNHQLICTFYTKHDTTESVEIIQTIEHNTTSSPAVNRLLNCDVYRNTTKLFNVHLLNLNENRYSFNYYNKGQDEKTIKLFRGIFKRELKLVAHYCQYEPGLKCIAGKNDDETLSNLYMFINSTLPRIRSDLEKATAFLKKFYYEIEGTRKVKQQLKSTSTVRYEFSDNKYDNRTWILTVSKKDNGYNIELYPQNSKNEFCITIPLNGTEDFDILMRSKSMTTQIKSQFVDNREITVLGCYLGKGNCNLLDTIQGMKNNNGSVKILQSPNNEVISLAFAYKDYPISCELRSDGLAIISLENDIKLVGSYVNKKLHYTDIQIPDVDNYSELDIEKIVSDKIEKWARTIYSRENEQNIVSNMAGMSL